MTSPPYRERACLHADTPALVTLHAPSPRASTQVSP